MGSDLLKKGKKPKQVIFQFSLPWLNILTEIVLFICSHLFEILWTAFYPIAVTSQACNHRPNGSRVEALRKSTSIFYPQYLPQQFSNGKQGGALPPHEQQGPATIKCWKGAQGRIFGKSLGGNAPSCLPLGKYYIFVLYTHNIYFLNSGCQISLSADR